MRLYESFVDLCVDLCVDLLEDLFVDLLERLVDPIAFSHRDIATSLLITADVAAIQRSSRLITN